LPAPYGPLRRDIEMEILIIGAGITGAKVGDVLATARLKVVVVDKRGPPRVLLLRALVQYEIDTPLTKLPARSER
jgi:choline dehydrogenase-like flavoprotein